MLRELSRVLPDQMPHRPSGRTGAHRVPGEEDPAQGRGPGGADGGAYRVKKRTWGALNGVWVPHDVRYQIVDFVRRWSGAGEIGGGRLVAWLGVASGRFDGW